MRKKLKILFKKPSHQGGPQNVASAETQQQKDLFGISQVSLPSTLILFGQNHLCCNDVQIHRLVEKLRDQWCSITQNENKGKKQTSKIFFNWPFLRFELLGSNKFRLDASNSINGIISLNE